MVIQPRCVDHPHLAGLGSAGRSPDMIDVACAAVMAWRARLDAVAAGLGTRRKKAVIARVTGGALG
jgi:hypothetical protein